MAQDIIIDQISRDVFTGDVSTTTQGYLNNSTPGLPVTVRDLQGLTIANADGSQTVNLQVTASSTLTIAGTINPTAVGTNSITTKGILNLSVGSRGAGVLLPSGQHLALGGVPDSRWTLDVIAAAQPGVAEAIQRWTVADATSDYFEVANASNANGTFVPAFQAVQLSNAALAALRVYGTVAVANDIANDSCCVAFGAQQLGGALLVNKTLYQWRNGTGTRLATTMMEMIPSGSYADLIFPTAVAEKIRISGTTGNIAATGDIAAQGTGTFLRTILNNGVSGQDIITAKNNGTIAFAVLNGGNTNFANNQATNFRVENIATPAAGHAGRLIIDGTILKYDDGSAFKTVSTPFTGDIASTTQGYLSSSSTYAECHTDGGLRLSNVAQTAAAILSVGPDPTQLTISADTTITSLTSGPTTVKSDAGLAVQNDASRTGFRALTLHALTTNATPTAFLSIDESSPTFPTLATDSTHVYTAYIAARGLSGTNNNLSAAWRVSALLGNTAGTDTVIGWIKEVIGNEVSLTWDVDVQVNGSHQLNIQVTGDNASDVSWSGWITDSAA